MLTHEMHLRCHKTVQTPAHMETLITNSHLAAGKFSLLLFLELMVLTGLGGFYDSTYMACHWGARYFWNSLFLWFCKKALLDGLPHP